MKIIGQSTLANGTPFVHLGYLATTHLEPKSPLFGSGLALLIVGIAVGFSLRFGKNKSGSTTISIARRKRPALVGAGVVMVVVGGIGVVLSVAYGKRVYDHAARITQVRAWEVLEQVEQCISDGQPIPVDMAASKASSPSQGAERPTITDGWFREMRLVKEAEAGREVVFVVSAGRDGEFGTGDDLRYSLDEYRQRSGSMLATTRQAETKPAH